MEETCKACGSDTTEANPGCSASEIYVEGESFDRIAQKPPMACKSCCTPPGEIHHIGCEKEKCPLCGGKLFECGHLQLGKSDSSGPPMTVKEYVETMKSALEAFGDTWELAIKRDSTISNAMSFSSWNDQFVDFCSEVDGDEEEKA